MMTIVELEEKMTELEKLQTETENLHVKLKAQISELKAQHKELPEPPHQRLKLNVGDTFYYVDNNGGVFRGSWYNTPWDFGRLAIGNVFRTEEAAKYAAEYYKVLAEMSEWAGHNDDGAYIYYHKPSDKILVGWSDYSTCCFEGIHFKCLDDAENCIKAVGKDRLIKYYFGVRDHEADAETE